MEVVKLTELTLIEPFIGSKAIAKELKIDVRDRGYQWYAAIESGKAVGFAAVATIKSGTFPFKGAGFELKYVYTVPECRRQGIGNALMQMVFSQHQGRFKAVITPSTQAFYEKLGFVKVDSRSQYPLMYREQKQ